MQPRILGLDLSLTGTGVSCPECGETVITTKKVEAEERLVLIRDTIWMEHLPSEFLAGPVAGHVDLVVLEGYAMGTTRQSHSYAIGELGGVIRLMLHELKVPWLAIPPARLKKWATGKGNAQKDVMLAAAIRNFGYGGSNNNEADAYLLRRMAESHYSGVKQPGYRQEIDREVPWPSVEGLIDEVVT